jgi:hypothetical protein
MSESRSEDHLGPCAAQGQPCERAGTILGMQTALAAGNATAAPPKASHGTIEGSPRTAPLACYISKVAGT